MQVYSVNPNIKLAQGVPSGLSEYATCICFGKCEYKILLYIDVFGALAIWSTNENRWAVQGTKIATFSVSVNANHPTMTWTAPGKILRAGITNAGSSTDPGGNEGPGLACTFEGNVVTVTMWKFGGNCSASGFVVYE